MPIGPTCRISGPGRTCSKPEEKAIGFAYTFLGIRIQCAQCHKHPFDQWSKDDFDDFRNFFAGCPSHQYAGPRRSARARTNISDPEGTGARKSELQRQPTAQPVMASSGRRQSRALPRGIAGHRPIGCDGQSGKEIAEVVEVALRPLIERVLVALSALNADAEDVYAKPDCFFFRLY